MVRAIETRYLGCRFRSRLEARYAVLFEELGLQWEHEPEGFELSCGKRYLPDFLVRFQPDDRDGFYFEVKPTLPTTEEVLKCHCLAKDLNEQRLSKGEAVRPVFMLCGTPGHPNVWSGDGPWRLTKGSVALKFTGLTQLERPLVRFETWAMVDGGQELDIWPIYFRVEHQVLVRQVDRFEGPARFLTAWLPQTIQQATYFGRGVDFVHPRLEAAYSAARSARFGVGGRG